MKEYSEQTVIRQNVPKYNNLQLLHFVGSVCVNPFLFIALCFHKTEHVQLGLYYDVVMLKTFVELGCESVFMYVFRL